MSTLAMTTLRRSVKLTVLLGVPALFLFFVPATIQKYQRAREDAFKQELDAKSKIASILDPIEIFEKHRSHKKQEGTTGHKIEIGNTDLQTRIESMVQFFKEDSIHSKTWDLDQIQIKFNTIDLSLLSDQLSVVEALDRVVKADHPTYSKFHTIFKLKKPKAIWSISNGPKLMPKSPAEVQKMILADLYNQIVDCLSTELEENALQCIDVAMGSSLSALEIKP